ncbi:hypothetical protein CPB86DRAFT_817710 [Serendipita vermifera]|nr:hypothetical protein CPB86DRAFT_817710 [Serendipita vermifera]
MALDKRQSQNLVDWDEAFGDGKWECSSPDSTPWAMCDGKCMYIEQEGYYAFFPLATSNPTTLSINNAQRAFELSFDVMILWNANGTAPTASPVDQLQINTVLGLASTNYNQWVPVYNSDATSASFTRFSWRGRIPDSYTFGSAQLHLNLDHPPVGNGWYGVYVDKVSLVAITTTTTTSVANTSSGSQGSASTLPSQSTSLNTTQSINGTTSTALSQTGSLSDQSWITKDPESSQPTGSTTSSSSPTPNVNRIAMIASISAFFGLVLIAVIAWWFLWKKRQRRLESQALMGPVDSSARPTTASNLTQGAISDATLPSNLGRRNWAIGTEVSDTSLVSPAYVTPVERNAAPFHLDHDLPPAYDPGSPSRQIRMLGGLGQASDRKRRLNP